MRGIDEYLLRDVGAMQAFIGDEMTAGVLEAVEAWLVDELAAADGHQVQAFPDDAFTTARMSVTALQNVGLAPGAFILSPDGCALMETAKASGSGTYLFNSAPVDQARGTLWSVPVVTFVRVAAGGGHLLDPDSVELFHDGQLNLS